MIKLSVYVPDDVAGELHRQAKQRGQSLSLLVVDLMRHRLVRAGWEDGFFDEVVGKWQGDFPDIARPPP